MPQLDCQRIFSLQLESLASASEVREVGALRDDRSGDGRRRREKIRAVAQLGRALRSGRRGRGFKSHQPDILHLGGAWLLRPGVVYLPKSVFVPGPN